jgi:hypothetical protein
VGVGGGMGGVGGELKGSRQWLSRRAERRSSPHLYVYMCLCVCEERERDREITEW